MTGDEFKAQMLSALKRLYRGHMEAELKHLSLPVDERLNIEAKYWWDKAMGAARSHRAEEVQEE